MISERQNDFQKLMRDFSQLAPYNVVHALRPEEPIDTRRWQDAAHRFFDRQFPGHKVPVDTLEGDFDASMANLMNLSLAELNPSLRAFSLEDNQGRVWVGLVVDHWIVDDFSIRKLLEGIQNEFLRDRPDAAPLQWRPPAETNWGLLGSWWLLSKMQEHRTASRLPVRDPLDFHVGTLSLDLEPGIIERIVQWARARGVTANDVFLATLARAASRQLATREGDPGPRVSLAIPVDLRKHETGPQADQPGFALGYFSLVADGSDLPLDLSVRRVGEETRRWKSHRARCLAPLAPARALWSATRGDASRATLFQRGLRLSCGLSNVNLNGSWVESGPLPIAAYRRFGPAGPMVPLVGEVTTLGEHLALDLTYRTAALTQAQASQIGHDWVRELTRVGVPQLGEPILAS